MIVLISYTHLSWSFSIKYPSESPDFMIDINGDIHVNCDYKELFFPLSSRISKIRASGTRDTKELKITFNKEYQDIYNLIVKYDQNNKFITLKSISFDFMISNCSITEYEPSKK
ncbi:hypothetical protein HZS_6193 [Henneguya salminicola]|nr:hypothetical protein HZS_6193 [Henneguya salminicola]